MTYTEIMSSQFAKLLIILLFLFGTSSQVWSASGWTSFGVVSELTPTSQGHFIVKIDGLATPSNCREKNYFYRNYSGTGADYMFTLLLNAVTDNKKVRVYVTGGCDLNGYSEISSASIVP
ncbi:MAG: hypothetical protein KQH63_16975 [Desulfobulbaceae bacterium]|nr:hypothetical protein [Desulfobulbaceae bacterium]